MQLLIVFFKGDGFCRAGHLAGAAEPAICTDDHLVVFYDWHAKGAGDVYKRQMLYRGKTKAARYKNELMIRYYLIIN